MADSITQPPVRVPPWTTEVVERPAHVAATASAGGAHAVRPAGGPTDVPFEALSHRMLVRKRRARPARGWRRAAYTLTDGWFNPGPSSREAAQRQQIVRIRAPLGGWHTVTVVSAKGGTGKTTVSALLGLVLAEHRGDRVIALDANPDVGTLGDRVLGHRPTQTVRDLITHIGAVQSLTDVTRFTDLAGRLHVLASEHDPAMTNIFNRDEYHQVTDILKRFYNIIITDSGPGLLHCAMSAALAGTRTLVVVGSPTVDGASQAKTTLDWLSAHGQGELAANAVVVLSCDRWSPEVDQHAVRRHFASRCRAVVEIPADPHLATGGHIQLDELRPPTLDAVLALGAHVADQFRWSHAQQSPARTSPDVVDGST